MSRIRAFAAVAALATVALVVLVAIDVAGQYDGLRAIGDQAAPEAVAASDLYFALNDMDAQVANVLLVGGDQDLGFTRAQALAIYEQRRPARRRRAATRRVSRRPPRWRCTGRRPTC